MADKEDKKPKESNAANETNPADAEKPSDSATANEPEKGSGSKETSKKVSKKVSKKAAKGIAGLKEQYDKAEDGIKRHRRQRDKLEHGQKINPGILMSLVTISLVIVAAIILFSLHNKSKPRIGIGKANQVLGKISVKRNDHYYELEATQPVLSGDLIGVPYKGKIIFEFFDEETLVELKSNSKLQLEMIGSEKHLFLEFGTLAIKAAAQKTAVFIKSRELILEFSDAALEMKSSSRKIELLVLNGIVKVTNEVTDESLTLKAGENYSMIPTEKNNDPGE